MKQLLSILVAAAMSATAAIVAVGADADGLSVASMAQLTQAQAESLLLEWSNALLSRQIKEGEEYGNFVCDACSGQVHGRVIDTVWPLTWLWQRTGDQRYLEAARDAVHWGALHMQQPDGSYTNEYHNPWRGITEFSQISLGKTLMRYGDVLPPEIADEWRDLFVRQSDYVYSWIAEPLGDLNINYQAARPLCMELAFRLTGEQRFRECALQQAAGMAAHIGPDGVLFGESHPSMYLSARGVRGVDMGYNVEESLPLLFEYAELAGDEALTEILVASARAQLDFILPDGGLDNSFGSRSNKWSYWGSRTSDGILPMLSALARHGCPEAIRAARYTLGLYERCTDSTGLLTGGIFYEAAGEPACVHHSFCHIKPLPDWIEADFSSLADAACPPIPSETAYGVKYFPSRDIHLISTRSWRATVNNADYWFNRESQATAGGSLSLLYHRVAGLVLAGTSMEYKIDEPLNMQWQTHDTLTLSFTPRIESGEFTNVYDKEATVSVKGGKNRVRVVVEGNLTNVDGESSAPFRLEYRLRGDKLKIFASGEGEFVLPLICSPDDELKECADGGFCIVRDAATISVSASTSVVPGHTARPEGYAFTPIAGLVSPYFSIPLEGRTKIEVAVR